MSNVRKRFGTHQALAGIDLEIARGEVASIALPVSAMPPVAAALPPRDFRDLVAFLASQKGGKGKDGDASHGDGAAIAK